MKKNLALLAIVAVFFAACGDSVENTNINQTSVDVVASEDKLPECTEDNEGDQAYVKGETSARLCMGGKWLASAGGKDTVVVAGDTVYLGGDFSCATEELADKSGLKIICNGDSIGVVLNGKKGDNGTGCTMTLNDTAVTVVCGDSTTTIKLNASKPAADTSVTDSGDVEVSLDSLTGYSQKGPFLKGSRVFLYELDNGRTLKQTNGNFTSYITDDNGRYKFTSRNIRPYAIIIVDGNYRNEVTGDVSEQAIRLQALCDVRKHRNDGANVNILTHMEYERVYYLVTQKGLDFEDAKQTAQKEVFRAFEIELEETKDAELLNVFGTSDADAALLAISILVQSDLSVPDMMVLLTEISNELADDGYWKDETGRAASLKARIADWAMKVDDSGELDEIYNHVADWGLGPVPYFQEYVRDYWRKIYGLEECNREGLVVGTKNQESQYNENKSQTRFICFAGRWRIASDEEKDTFEWDDGEDGEIREGSVTGEKYIYDKEDSCWKAATPLEIALGGCTAAIENDNSRNAGYFEDAWYICKDHNWEFSDDMTIDKHSFPEGTDGYIAEGAITHTKYKYDEILGAWTHISEADTSTALGLFVCTSKHSGELRAGENDLYYICASDDAGVANWRLASTLDRDTEGAVCNVENLGKVIHGAVLPKNLYYCVDSGWISLMDGWDWGIPKEARLNPDITYDTIIDSRDGQSYKIVTIGEQVWMAENLNYYVASSRCYDDVAEHCNVTGRLYTWATAVGKQETECGVGYSCGLTLPVQGVCPNGWHLPSRDELQTLVDSSGGREIGGYRLKSLSGWAPGGNGMDSVGFAALPGGRVAENVFSNLDDQGGFWSATESSYGAAILRLYRYNQELFLNDEVKNIGYSVRCIKNSAPAPEDD